MLGQGAAGAERAQRGEQAHDGEQVAVHAVAALLHDFWNSALAAQCTRRDSACSAALKRTALGMM